MIRHLAKWIAAIAIALLVGLPASTAAAEDEGESKRDVIRFDVVVVHGVAHKPNAFFINTRRSLVYQDLEVRQSFVGEIIEPIEDREF
jgi:hypothetical protein